MGFGMQILPLLVAITLFVMILLAISFFVKDKSTKKLLYWIVGMVFGSPIALYLLVWLLYVISGLFVGD